MKPQTINAICKKILTEYGEIMFKDDYDIPHTINRNRDLLKEFGFGYIGQGSTRIAFGNLHYVIKIGNPQDNAKELDAYMVLDKHDVLKYTKVPVFKHIELAHSLSINITARCKAPKWPTKTTKLVKVHKALKAFYSDNGERNFGLFGKSLVMLDLNYPYYGDPAPHYVDHYKSLINFEAHKQAYDARVNKLQLVA
jgi:hypothetical protein